MAQVPTPEVTQAMPDIFSVAIPLQNGGHLDVLLPKQVVAQSNKQQPMRMQRKVKVEKQR